MSFVAVFGSRIRNMGSRSGIRDLGWLKKTGFRIRDKHPRSASLITNCHFPVPPPSPHHPSLFPSSNVADPGCLSWILDPDFFPLQIQDLGSKNILIFKCRGKIIGLVL
jgi:hypothetical protein